MEVFKTIITALSSIITLFILTKLMGNRQFSQLSMFDYINSITIGSIAAELSTSTFTDSLKPFIAMTVFALVNILLAFLTDKSIKLRRLVTGKPTILYDDGNLYYKNLAAAKIDLNEFLMQCRLNGYFDLSYLQTVILECNGELSFIPHANERPITPKDLKLSPSQDQLVANVIIDGKIMPQNLQYTGHDENWLYNELDRHNINSPSEVLLATCDSNNTLNIYKKTSTKMDINILE